MKCLLIFLVFYMLILNSNLSFSQKLPIKPTRTISFSTDEGSYMNIDISPDGKTLLFDLLGDIYSVASAGGSATQLTRGISLNLRPVWSPDGKRFAYISDISGAFHLNVRDIEGSFHCILGKEDPEINYGTDALWLPNCNYIFIDGSIYGLAGGRMPLQLNDSHPLRFSSDGEILYLLDSGNIYNYNYAKNSRTVIFRDLGRSLNGTLSPDGNWWACVSDSGSNRCLIVKDIRNNTERILVSSLLEKSTYRAGILSRYVFSPDSKSIFISYGGKIHRIEVESGVDHIIPFTAIVKSDIGTYNYNTFRVLEDSVKVKFIRSANASPDGKHIVFSALNKLYVKDLPNGPSYVLAPQSVSQFQPVYSPDGKWIAYVSWCDTVGGHVWRVLASGGQPEQLTHISGQYQRPIWSPDGKLIAVVKGVPQLLDRDQEGIGQLLLISVNGEPERMVEDTVPLWNQLDFIKDGSRVIYQPRNLQNGNNSLRPLLVSKNLEGKDLRTLLTGEVDPFLHLQQRSISPDRRFIVYSADEDLYLVPVCQLTTPQVIYDSRQNLQLIKFAEGVDPYWEKDGKILSWSYGAKFYRINPDKIIGAAEKLLEKQESNGLREDKYITVTPKPDQVVDIKVTVPKLYAHGLVALRDVRILTMQRDKIIEHGTIIIKNGRFAAVGSSGAVRIPPGTKVFDLPGTTIMPGLVDLHLHMRIPPDIFPQQSWMFLTNLAYGVTTVRDPSLSFDSYGYKELLESGQMIGPRLYTVGRAARIPDGMIRCDNIEDARALVHKRALFGGTVIKQYELPTRLQRQWLLIACHEMGLNMTNEGAFDPILQIAMIKDGSTGIEHNPIWGDVYKDVFYFIAASGIYFTPTLQVCYGEEAGKEYFKYKYWRLPDKKLLHFTLSDSSQKGPLSNGAESIEVICNAHPKDTVQPGFIIPAIIDARIHREGGNIALGSHGNNQGIGPHNELWALQMGGISNLEALKAATIKGAQALGIQKDVGTIEVGKIADLIVLNRNPLEDIHNSKEIRFVMKDGILYEGDTLDEIWPIAKKCPEWKLRTSAKLKIYER